MLSTIIFLILFGTGAGLFAWRVGKIRAAIALGRPDDRSDRSGERLKQMTLVALGQQKMFKNWMPALMHFFIYAAFVITQVELIEILVDGIAGTHRFFYPILGGFYVFVISTIEVLSVLAFVATLIFLVRRNLLYIPRLASLKGWPKLDGNLILFLEILLIVFIFMMNGGDEVLYNQGHTHAEGVEGISGSFGFAVSQFLGPALFGGLSVEGLEMVERIGWWGHILIVLSFLVYLPFSKHFHVLLAFPNVYFSNVGLLPKGKLNNLGNVTEEMKAILDPAYQPVEDPNGPQRFGAKDVTDLSWKTLMDAYTCTECGRCTAACPANMTGKQLSPRKLVMDVRDRLEEIQKFKLTPGEDGLLVPGNGVEGAEEAAAHTLLGDHYITEEELRACNTCNACVEACPVNINHMDIVLPLRQYLVMEESAMPEEWGIMFNNVENNGAPWAMPAADRFKWAEELEQEESNA